MGMSDVFMVRGLGEVAVASVGLATKLHFLLTVLMAGVSTAAGVLIAQNYGAGNQGSCVRVLVVSLIIGSVLMLPCMLLFSWNNSVWIGLIAPDSNVVQLCSQYLLITAPALLITQFVVIYEAGLRSIGNTIVPLLIGLAAGLANIALNYIFIFGKLGFPEMGVSGAAWGTLSARAFQLLLFWLWLCTNKNVFAPKISEVKNAINKKDISSFVSFSFPLIFNYLLWALGNSAYHIFTGYSGTGALAIMGILAPIETAFFALFIGLANASSVMIGHSLGADKKQEAWSLFSFYDRFAFVLAISFCGLLYLASPWLISIFVEEQSETAEVLRDVFLIFCLLTWVKVLNLMRIIGVLRAGGDNNYVLWVDVSAMWFLGIPIFMLCIFFFDLPFVYVFVAMYIEDLAKALPMYWRVKGRYWLKNLSYKAS